MRCINGLERPDGGTIEFDGKIVEPTRRQLKALRREIGIVFQSYNLFPHLSVERNITLGPTAAKGMPLAAARDLAAKVLRMVDLEDKIAAYPQQLSGGQQQRVAIARALAMEPRLVLFDEITAALDPELIGEVVRVLERLAQGGMTMVLVTHEMGFARKSADTILFMHQGRIWEKARPPNCSAPRAPPNWPPSSTPSCRSTPPPNAAPGDRSGAGPSIAARIESGGLHRSAKFQAGALVRAGHPLGILDLTYQL